MSRIGTVLALGGIAAVIELVLLAILALVLPAFSSAGSSEGAWFGDLVARLFVTFALVPLVIWLVVLLISATRRRGTPPLRLVVGSSIVLFVIEAAFWILVVGLSAGLGSMAGLIVPLALLVSALLPIGAILAGLVLRRRLGLRDGEKATRA